SAPVTTLLVTHSVDDAARLADRIVLLSQRPAQILAELRIATPRAARGPADLAALSAEVARLSAGLHDTAGRHRD
ncbi:MAG TPA: ABC transporter ATP-binding protein, partial [Rhodopseudomonas sp.]